MDSIRYRYCKIKKNHSPSSSDFDFYLIFRDFTSKIGLHEGYREKGLIEGYMRVSVGGPNSFLSFILVR